MSTNYQKQTYRNRCIICTPNGIQNLIIPIKHNQNIFPPHPDLTGRTLGQIPVCPHWIDSSKGPTKGNRENICMLNTFLGFEMV